MQFDMSKIHWLGVDTGGTFTDFVYFDGQSVRVHKVLSTPSSPERAILQGIQEMRLDTQNLHLVHGSTVATNAVLEAKGVKTVYITNQGFTDVLSIGRQARQQLYNLSPVPRPELIQPEHCLSLNVRVNAQGKELSTLHDAQLEQLLAQLQQISPSSVAVNFLFSFLNSQHEQQLKTFLKKKLPELFISCSSDVLAEYREYERGMATALNAYVGPLMQGYLNRLGKALQSFVEHQQQAAVLSVMQSSGGTISAEQAGQHAVSLLLSGPAGGLKGAQYIASLSGQQQLMSFDMGGTSTDVALMDGNIRLTSEGMIGDYPVAVPMVDMHTIGAGGGSIAFVDSGGLLNVGPKSAGASPGPACYGAGGKDATVTDANLILGRLRSDGFLGKGMSLDIAAAQQAMQSIADTLQLTLEQAAEGVIRIANEHMARALRTISVQRGFDPQNFTLISFGGAGGLHVCALADALSMKRALVPVYGGVLSALGMLVSPPGRELSVSAIQLLSSLEIDGLSQMFAELEVKGVAEMQAELAGDLPRLQRSLDLRYQGQSFTLNIAINDGEEITIQSLQQQFHQLHRQTYGHELQLPVELVNIRLSLRGMASPFSLPEVQSQNVEMNSASSIECYGYPEGVQLYQREQLQAGQLIEGPALVLEKVSTTLIDRNWNCRVDAVGNLQLTREAD